MYTFSKNSQKHFDTCAPQLQRLLLEAIKYYNFSIAYGYRNETEQNLAYSTGFSKLKFPNSKHNSNPSQAVDIYPYHPVFGSLTEDPTVIKRIQSRIDKTPLAVKQFIHQEYCVMSGVILTCAQKLGIKLRWGGDWDGDGNRLNNTFNDLAHFELVD